MRIDKQGIEFSHRGDDVLWLWPWRRERWNRRYISFGFDGVFSSLSELDKLWEDYFAAEKDVFEVAITYTCAHCGVLAGVPLSDMGVFDSGATLTCSHCGKDTIFLLVTPAGYLALGLS